MDLIICCYVLQSFWNVMEFIVLLMLVITIGMFFARFALTMSTSNKFSENPESFVSFQFATTWDEVCNAIRIQTEFACLLPLASIYLHVIKKPLIFRPKIFRNCEPCFLFLDLWLLAVVYNIHRYSESAQATQVQ